MLARSDTSWTPSSSIADAVTAVIAIGTSWMSWARRCAVTTMVSRSSSCAPAAVHVSSADGNAAVNSQADRLDIVVMGSSPPAEQLGVCGRRAPRAPAASLVGRAPRAADATRPDNGRASRPRARESARAARQIGEVARRSAIWPRGTSAPLRLKF